MFSAFTGGRANLVSGGIELFGDQPVVGSGSGSFSVAFREQVSGPDAPVTESHTEPITVAAEQGLVGLTVYALLIACSLFVLAFGMRRLMPGLADGLSRRDAPSPGDPDRGPPPAADEVLRAGPRPWRDGPCRYTGP